MNVKVQHSSLSLRSVNYSEIYSIIFDLVLKLDKKMVSGGPFLTAILIAQMLKEFSSGKNIILEFIISKCFALFIDGI